MICPNIDNEKKDVMDEAARLYSSAIETTRTSSQIKGNKICNGIAAQDWPFPSEIFNTGLQSDRVMKPILCIDSIFVLNQSSKNASANPLLEEKVNSKVKRKVFALTSAKPCITGVRSFEHRGKMNESIEGRVRYCSPAKVTRPTSGGSVEHMKVVSPVHQVLRHKSFESNRQGYYSAKRESLEFKQSIEASFINQQLSRRNSCDGNGTASNRKLEMMRIENDQPPKVIVFINNNIYRQKRRSSMCSQITVDECTDRSCDVWELGNDIQDERSLNMHEIFSELKGSVCRKSNDGSISSNNEGGSESSSSCCSSSILDEDKDSKQRFNRIEKRSTRSNRQSFKLLKSTNSTFSKRSSNSAKVRWIHEQNAESVNEHDTSSNNDLTESDFEDQESFQQALRHDLIRDVAGLVVADKDNQHKDDNGDANPNIFKAGSLHNPKTLLFMAMGRAA